MASAEQAQTANRRNDDAPPPSSGAGASGGGAPPVSRRISIAACIAACSASPYSARSRLPLVQWPTVTDLAFGSSSRGSPSRPRVAVSTSAAAAAARGWSRRASAARMIFSSGASTKRSTLGAERSPPTFGVLAEGHRSTPEGAAPRGDRGGEAPGRTSAGPSSSPPESASALSNDSGG